MHYSKSFPLRILKIFVSCIHKEKHKKSKAITCYEKYLMSKLRYSEKYHIFGSDIHFGTLEARY